LNGGEISFRLREPSGVFTSELSAIFMALVQIRGHHPREFIILSDNMSSLRVLQTRKISPRTHSLVYEIKEASWYEIHIMWIPSHVGVMGNERADRLAGEAVQGGTEFAAPVRPSDFQPLSRARLLDGWHCGRSGGRMGRYTYSILPSVSLVPWFKRFDSSRYVVTSMHMMMANHSCLRNRLGRINIVENPSCVCLGTIDHIMWSCERYDSERYQLWNDLRVTWGTPVRD
jgi:hypothetical protein